MSGPLDQETYIQLLRRRRALSARLHALAAEAQRLCGDFDDYATAAEGELWLGVIAPAQRPESAQMPAAPDCAQVDEHATKRNT